MQTLSYQPVDESGLVTPTTSVSPRRGDDYYVCNDYEAVRDAIDAGEPFEAHEVVGMRASPITINPAHVQHVRPAR